MDPLTCPRHPGTETYLRCSSCETPICLECSVEAAVGYQCPDCAGQRDDAAAPAASRASRPRGGGVSAPTARAADGRLPIALGARALAAAVVGALAGGLVLGPVLAQGLFFLLSAGFVGWAVAHGVFFGTGGVTSPFVRAAALAGGALTVAVGMASVALWDPVGSGRGDIGFLAYPAAVYGAWITVRSRLG